MVANTTKNYDKPSDLEKLNDLKQARSFVDANEPITISNSNFNWLVDKAERWVNRVENIHKPSERKTYNWSEKEKELMKINGLVPNNVAARICRGWTREDAVNIPKITEKGRQQRVIEGAARYNQALGESE